VPVSISVGSLTQVNYYQDRRGKLLAILYASEREDADDLARLLNFSAMIPAASSSWCIHKVRIALRGMLDQVGRAALQQKLEDIAVAARFVRPVAYFCKMSISHLEVE
jgi:hypothetical protein